VALEKLGRRDTLRLLGVGGLALAVPGRAGLGLAQALAGEAEAGALRPLGLFVGVTPTGLVEIVAHRSEMGQGIKTALAAAVVEELKADWGRVRIRQADADPRLGSQNTDGSRSARRLMGPMRKAGAAAREILVAAAAARWGVPATDCEARDHAVHHGERSLGFGALAEAAARLPVPADPPLTDDAALRYVGPGVPSVDLVPMTTGAAVYGADVVREGMLTAVIARPPALGAAWTAYDREAALAVPGVVAVEELEVRDLPTGMQPVGGIAVLAEHTWAALRGREALAVAWEPGPHAGHGSGAYRAELERRVGEAARAVRTQGDVDAALEASGRRVEASYFVPYLSQAPMEPPAAVAEVGDGTAELWAPTQNPQGVQSVVGQALGLEPSAVTVHVTLLGGGFGRKSKSDFAAEAAILAQRSGRPVRVQWTREDDLRHGFYHSLSVQRLEAGLDDAGRVTAWLHRTAFPPIGATFSGARSASQGELGLGLLGLPYRIPNLRLENAEAEAHLRIGWMRAVCNVFHAFAIGSFVDELARAAGRDTVEMLRELLGEPAKLRAADLGLEELPNYGEDEGPYPVDTGRLRGVLDRVVEAFEWQRALPEGHGKGVAVHRSFVSYVAVALEVAVDEDRVRVERAHIAIDCGEVLDEDRVRAQLEGAVAFGLSLALESVIDVEDGAVTTGNFDRYPVRRMHGMPRELVTHVLESDEAPGGVGEPGVPPVAPALCNALFDATGRRVRALPVSRDGFRV
jgi:isoquinoline 1-oxidoreductase beta subunit